MQSCVTHTSLELPSSAKMQLPYFCSSTHLKNQFVYWCSTFLLRNMHEKPTCEKTSPVVYGRGGYLVSPVNSILSYLARIHCSRNTLWFRGKCHQCSVTAYSLVLLHYLYFCVCGFFFIILFSFFSVSAVCTCNNQRFHYYKIFQKELR